MAIILIILRLLIVFGFIFIGAHVGGIGMGIHGMVGTLLLVLVFGLAPGKAPIDVMMIIVSAVAVASALQATGDLGYLVGVTDKFLRKHPSQITYYDPLAYWTFCLLTGTAHICYSLSPTISEIVQANKIRPERPLSVSVIAALLDITSSPVSAATAAIISTDILGLKGIDLADVMIVHILASFVAILVAVLVQNRIGRELEDDPIYQTKVASGEINPEEEQKRMQQINANPNPRARYSVHTFLLDAALVVTFGLFPQLKPYHMVDGVMMPTATSEVIEIVIISAAALILLVGKDNAVIAARGTVFAAGMNAMVSIFDIAWMGDTFFSGNKDFFVTHLADWVQAASFLFAVILFTASTMLFPQAAAVRTIYPLGVLLGIDPLCLLAMSPACNGYSFMSSYPTEVAAINFDRTGTTRTGRYVINHSFQLSGFTTTIVSIALALLITQLFY